MRLRGADMMEMQNIEWKRIWKDEYLAWICGFANAQGGTLCIGKNDNGQTVGLENSKKLLEDLPNKIRDAKCILPCRIYRKLGSRDRENLQCLQGRRHTTT